MGEVIGREVDARVERSQSGVRYTGKAVQAPPRSTLDGVQYTADWYLNHLLQGNVKVVNVGTGTTPITSAGAWVATTPDVHMQIPSGTVIFPVSIDINIDLRIDDTNMELVAAFADSLDTTPTGGTAQTIYNMKNDLAALSACTVQSDVTAITAMNTAGNKYVEFWRNNGTFGATPVAAQSEEGAMDSYRYDGRHKHAMPCIVGPSEMSLHVAKGTFTYFATIVWVELSTNVGLD